MIIANDSISSTPGPSTTLENSSSSQSDTTVVAVTDTAVSAPSSTSSDTKAIATDTHDVSARSSTSSDTNAIVTETPKIHAASSILPETNVITTETPTIRATSPSSPISDTKAAYSEGPISAQRVFKKTSPNGKLTMYLSSRDLVVYGDRIDRLTGVLLIDPEFVNGRKVYGQISLTFRYGREDEEVMGLKFCNEAVMCLTQLYPPPNGQIYFTTPLQEALLKRLGSNAYPFTMEITALAPPSVQLVPAKEYNGAPIGTSYDVRAYVAEEMDEQLHKRATIRMNIRVVQRAFAPPSPFRYVPGGGKTTKEQAKLNRKALLFGCKSAPVDNSFFQTQGKSRSVETVGTIHHHLSGTCSEIRVTHNSMPECHNKELSSLIKDTPTVTSDVTQEDSSPKHINETKENNCSNNDDNVAGVSGFAARVAFRDQHKLSPLPLARTISDNTEKRGESTWEENSPPIITIRKNSNQMPLKSLATRTESIESNEGHISDHFRSLCSSKRPSLAAYLVNVPKPEAMVEKPFLLSDGKVLLTSTLDKGIYSHGEDIRVTVQIKNNSTKSIKRIKVFVVQHVDVCMFSNGKFKNVVAMYSDKESCPIHSGDSFKKTYTLLPLNTTTKNWIALEDTYTKSNSYLASSVCPATGKPEDRNVFAIYVSYYVKVKLLTTVMGGDISLKLPFTLMHTCADYSTETLTRVKRIETEIKKFAQSTEKQGKENDGIKPEKDGT